MSELCPSHVCVEGAALIGVVGPDATVTYVTPSPVVDREFVAAADAAGRPERRFRFAAPCVEGDCTRWTGSRCGVVDLALTVAPHVGIEPDDGAPLPRCSIRARCRWFAQSGRSACRVCPQVVNVQPADPPGQPEPAHPKGADR